MSRRYPILRAWWMKLFKFSPGRLKYFTRTTFDWNIPLISCPGDVAGGGARGDEVARRLSEEAGSHI